MTDAERAFLKTQIDHIVVLETIQGDRLLAQILFVFDEGETPDLFCLEVEPGPDGTYVQKGDNGALDPALRHRHRTSPSGLNQTSYLAEILTAYRRILEK